MIDLEDFRTMLIERVEEWSREIEARAEKRGEKKGQKQGLKMGLKQGLEKGLEKGRRELLLRQLEIKFGQVDDRTRAQINAAGPTLLLQWGERLLTAERLSDVFGG
jgi:flagellar biosynthesis/type III secretory pathway protein FliH